MGTVRVDYTLTSLEPPHHSFRWLTSSLLCHCPPCAVFLTAVGPSLSSPPASYYSAPVHAPPYPPSAAGRDWSKVGLAAAAIVGMGTSAYLLCRQYLPTVRLEYPQQHSQGQLPPQPAMSGSQLATSSSYAIPLLHSTAAVGTTAATPSSLSSDPTSYQALPLTSAAHSTGLQLLSSGLPASSSSTSSSSSAPSSLSSVTSPVVTSSSVDRLGLRSLSGGLGGSDVRTEELLLRGVSEVRNELSDIATQLKQQAQDNRRILTALQHTMDNFSRDRKEQQTATRPLTGQQHQRDGEAVQGQSTQGWDTPASPRSRILTSSSPSPSSSHRGHERLPSAIDTAPVDVRSVSSWTLTNGRDSPRSAKSTSDTSPLPQSPAATTHSLPALAVPLSPNSSNGGTPLSSIDSRMHSVRSALDAVRSSNPAASALSALSSLSMYVSNVSPLHDKCRKVQLSNSNYQQRIARVQGAQDALIACGFTMKGKALEWETTDDKEADNQLLAQAREAMASMQAAITAAQQQQQQQESDEQHRDADAAAFSSAPLASPLPLSVNNNAVQSD